MATERKRVMGELAAFQVASIASMFGAKVSPDEINPYRQRARISPENRDLAEQDQREFARARSRKPDAKRRNVRSYPICQQADHQAAQVPEQSEPAGPTSKPS